jgi:hypothetical protein
MTSGRVLNGLRSARILLGTVAATAVAAGIIGFAWMGSAGAARPADHADPAAPAGAEPVNPKSLLPANINPAKSPVLNPPAVQKAKPPSRAQLLHEAQDLVAEDPGASLICYRADGTVAGVATVSKVDKNAPIANPTAICDRGWPGSHA